MPFLNFYVLAGGGIVLFLFLSAALRVVREYERLVIFRLGRLAGSRGPGLVLLIPGVDAAFRLSLRIVTYDVPTQDVITRDNVTTRVNAVVYYRIVDPALTLVNVENFHQATAELAQTTLRSVVGQAELDQLLTERERLNLQLQKILDDATDRWGIKVTAVEIKDVVIPEGLLSAIARQAEAERQRRALVIHAEGERQAAERLAEAARTLATEPGALSLRVLRTLPDIAARPGSVVVFPIPVELGPLLGRLGGPAEPERRLRLEDRREPPAAPLPS